MGQGGAGREVGSQKPERFGGVEQVCVPLVSERRANWCWTVCAGILGLKLELQLGLSQQDQEGTCNTCTSSTTDTGLVHVGFGHSTV